MRTTVSTEFVKKILKPRPINMHKGDAGRILIIAGSEGMAGAAVLAARGALYSGAGLVKICAPRELFTILQISSVESMCIARENWEERALSAKALKEYDSIAVGPGLGVSEENYRLIEHVMINYRGTLVIDADGLNCLSKYAGDKIPQLIKERSGATIITPHPGEADRMLTSMGEYRYRELGREKAAVTLAKKTGATVVLKGANTLTATCSGSAYGVKKREVDLRIYENSSGNPGMATGGSGDVLTGITTSLLGQKYLEVTPLKATLAAVYIHGLAGDIAASNIGEYGMTAADVADAISTALKLLQEEE